MAKKYCEIQKLIADPKSGKWWEDMKNIDDTKWKTMRHNGVLFADQYEPVPKKIKLLYEGKPVDVDSSNVKNKFNISAEEAAMFYAMKLEQDERLKEKNKKRKLTADDTVFKRNFWTDWKYILGSKHEIKSFEKVNFSQFQKYISSRSEDKKFNLKAKSKDEKLELKEEKLELKELYGYAIVDGVRIALGNYMIQPPGLYIGHGEHPLRGKIKRRIMPSDITLNVSLKYIPKCNVDGKECKWGDVVENHEVTWIASWKHPITDETNYVWLKREESHWVCADDMEKFNKARSLKENIVSIRQKYTKDLSSDNIQTNQLATAVYLLDSLAIRPGVDKDETKEAGTLGLTTLKCENITFRNDNRTIVIDFVGKSSINFNKEFEVTKIVYANLKSLCKGKTSKDKIFPNITANTLNDYLKTLLITLTAKVFRTYTASNILQDQLNKTKVDIYEPTHQKKLTYDKVNIEVAKALNHKKLSEGDGKVEKLKLKIKEIKNKLKEAKTDAQKKTAQKSLDIQEAKLEETELNISTSTSKVNYLDPRIVVSWCKSIEMPIEKIYNKTQLQKFVWSMDVDPAWQF